MLLVGELDTILWITHLRTEGDNVNDLKTEVHAVQTTYR